MTQYNKCTNTAVSDQPLALHCTPLRCLTTAPQPRSLTVAPPPACCSQEANGRSSCCAVVEYNRPEDAAAALKRLHHTLLDDRYIAVLPDTEEVRVGELERLKVDRHHQPYRGRTPDHIGRYDSYERRRSARSGSPDARHSLRHGRSRSPNSLRSSRQPPPKRAHSPDIAGARVGRLKSETDSSRDRRLNTAARPTDPAKSVLDSSNARTKLQPDDQPAACASKTGNGDVDALVSIVGGSPAAQPSTSNAAEVLARKTLQQILAPLKAAHDDAAAHGGRPAADAADIAAHISKQPSGAVDEGSQAAEEAGEEFEVSIVHRCTLRFVLSILRLQHTNFMELFHTPCISVIGMPQGCARIPSG